MLEETRGRSQVLWNSLGTEDAGELVDDNVLVPHSSSFGV